MIDPHGGVRRVRGRLRRIDSFWFGCSWMGQQLKKGFIEYVVAVQGRWWRLFCALLFRHCSLLIGARSWLSRTDTLVICGQRYRISGLASRIVDVYRRGDSIDGAADSAGTLIPCCSLGLEIGVLVARERV